jgi:H+-translocating NAD(P) transhydrogenase subunit alpha
MLLTNLAILVLAGFAGYLTISKVPNTLHTPLMSGTNAIHGIVVLGGIIVLGLGVEGFLSKLLLVIAIAFGTINVVGGFLVTDRMLEMFKGRPREDRQASREPEHLGPGAGADARGATPRSAVEARERAPGGGDAS